MKEAHLVADGTVALVYSDRFALASLCGKVGRWEGHEENVFELSAVAGAMIWTTGGGFSSHISA